jgi:ribosomal protein L11 methyltransferase
VSSQTALTLTVVGDQTQVDVAVDAIWSAGAVGIEERFGGPDRTVLVAGFPTDEATRAAAAALAPRWDSSIDAAGRHDEWIDHLEPIRVGGLVVCPSDLDVVRIDPRTAFGSGAHPSTRMALELISELGVSAGQTVLDVGCGTGVLAICALALGAGEAVAIDIDAEAVAATIRNAELNLCDDRLYASTTPLADVPGTYDLVVSNLTAGVQADLATELVAHMATHGHLVLSGLLADRVDQLIIPLGLNELSRNRSEDWVAVVLGNDG